MFAGEPIDCRLDGRDRVPRLRRGTPYDDDRKPEFAGGEDLRLGRGTPARLADEHVYCITFEPLTLLGQGEGAASNDDLVTAQRQTPARGIDEPYEKADPGRRCKTRDLPGSDREEGAPPETADDLGRGCHAVALGPAVERVATPRRPQQQQSRHPSLLAGEPRRGRDPGREGVGRVDQPIHPLFGQIGGETCCAAKAADADATGKRTGALGSSRKRGRKVERLAKAGDHGAGEEGGFAGAAKD